MPAMEAIILAQRALHTNIKEKDYTLLIAKELEKALTTKKSKSSNDKR